MREHLQAIVTVLSLVNPVVCGATFARIEADCSRSKQTADATKAALAILAILVLAALVGIRLLDLFGVPLDAFMVAGGGVLAWMGFSMLSGQGLSRSSDAPANAKASLTPLILFAASVPRTGDRRQRSNLRSRGALSASMCKPGRGGEDPDNAARRCSIDVSSVVMLDLVCAFQMPFRSIELMAVLTVACVASAL